MKPRSETSAAQRPPIFLSQWFNPRMVNNQSDALPSIRPIAAFGRIGSNVAKTLFKTRLSVAQPNRARQEMMTMLRLAISGTRFRADPRVALLINNLTSAANTQPESRLPAILHQVILSIPAD